MKFKEIWKSFWKEVWDWICNAEITFKQDKKSSGGVDVNIKVGGRDDES